MESEKIDQRQIKYVDDREPEVIRTKLIEYGWYSKRLWSSDFYFMTHDYKKAGVTRKTIQDLLNSIGDRFSKQLEEMLDFFDIRIILLEGSWKAVSPSAPGARLITGRGIEHYTWDMVWNYLRRWQDKGYTIELTVNEGHTVQRLNSIYALYQKPSSSSARSKSWADDRVLALPSGVRGATGEKLLKGRSIAELCTMSKEQLLSIDGIGEKKAESIYQHLRKVV